MFMIFQIIHFVFAIITFPGIIVHEIAHRFFCDITKTAVYEIDYLNLSNFSTTGYLGYVKHKEAIGLRKNILINLGPLLLNTFFCVVFTTPYAMSIAANAGNVLNFSHIFLLWLGFSIGVHALPSKQDIINLTKYISSYHNFFTQILYFPFRVLFFLSRILSFFWFDAILTFGIIYLNILLYQKIFSYLPY